MAAFGILGFGAAVPKRRMCRKAIYDAVGWAQGGLRNHARGARAFAAWDEDAITMSVEAARMALRSAGGAPATLIFASTTAPFLDRQNAGVVAAALDLPSSIRTIDVAGSQRAALTPLIAACRSLDGPTLVTAADKRPVKSASLAEMLYGDAGAAMLVGAGKPVAEFIASHSTTADFVDHYRTDASHTDYAFEERWVRDAGVGPIIGDAVKALLVKSGVAAAEIACFIAPLTTAGLARAAAEAAGVRKESISDLLIENCGVAGVAHPLLMLAAALENATPGDYILVTAFGQGCDAALFRASERVRDLAGVVRQSLAPRSPETNYTKFLAASDRLDIDWGMRAERDNRTAQTVAYNKSHDLYGFVGGKCANCGTPQFPKSRRCVNPDCAALDTQTGYRFADRRGVIKTFTEDWLAFTREPPLVYGNVSFEGGGNVFMEMADFAPGEARVGASVEMRFRIKDIDRARGFHRYFWKAVPAAEASYG